MKTQRSLFVVGALLVVGAVSVVGAQPGLAQVKKIGKNYQLRMKWVKGAKISYELAVQTGGSQAPGLTGLDYTVTSVKGTTGTVDVSVRQGGAAPQKETVTIDDRGRMAGSATAAGFSNILEFPAEAIAVGGTWTTKASMPGVGSGTMDGTAKNTLKGFRTIEGKQYAHIFSTVTTVGGGLDGAGKTDSLVAMSDGHILRMTMNMKMSLKMKDSQGKTQTQSIDVVVKMTRK